MRRPDRSCRTAAPSMCRPAARTSIPCSRGWTRTRPGPPMCSTANSPPTRIVTGSWKRSSARLCAGRKRSRMRDRLRGPSIWTERPIQFLGSPHVRIEIRTSPAPGSGRESTLSPWWLRPTAEGMQEQENDKPQRASQEPAAPPETPPVESAPEPPPMEAMSVAEEPLPISQGTEPEPEPAWRYVDEAAPEREPDAEPVLAEAREEGTEEEKEGEIPVAGESEEDVRRRKRSRRGRRRKNDRTTDAAAAEPGEEEDEEDESFGEEPAEEAPA